MTFIECAGPFAQTCPSPVKRAVMKQGWCDLAYIHFRYDPEVVQRLLPPVPYLGSFPDVNVRTRIHLSIGGEITDPSPLEIFL